MNEADLMGLYDRYAAELEDFWARRAVFPRFGRTVHLFGRAVSLTANDAGVLAAAEKLPPLYSSAPTLSEPPFTLQLVVQPPRRPVGPPPDDLIQHITYTGSADWLLLHLGAWGHAQVDLMRGRAVVVLAPSLAQRPDLVAGCVLHTVLLNCFIAAGYGLLHASCLVRGRQALLLLAPHNTGKSTTALRLALNGYRLLSDSMVFVPPGGGLLLGFPVGITKLRGDMLAAFPELQPLLAAEPVRDELKYRLDLGRVGEERVQREGISAENLTLILLNRHDQTASQTRPAAADAVWAAVMRNSLYYDTPAVWQRNLTALAPLIARTRAYHLTLGRDEARLLDAVEALFSA